MSRISHDELTKDDFLNHLFIEALVSALDDVQLEEFLKNNMDWENPNGVSELSLVINGVEFDLFPVLSFWETQIDRMIHKEAEEMFKDKLQELDNLTYSLKRQYSEFLAEECNMNLEEW